ncbi:type VII secretion-associated serine protease mycosin [Mycolicibacterium austroafricanum]|uniref:Type VII secretion-associated serine protease mycosin n=1 Tax=Mycolicibacterium austroafricanum TaxID=39687 RepID=A0ABT8H8A1_MYCAO|nr:type VII secretion-associated serine protease mycosin [Mycolicibacterium austroafricanum]MDN4516991.1 type VII secretion-associated serine protease mycosin [Mycolicibacterium austroafricanum]QRZ08085.1 type VII secretion-associated serine protease mycosin [Mycolicibacterium austroafricanum]QZT69748.1 type VII secretion-associated serine protease mycosin [Mycolicibacterium austroafricanum]
MTGPARPWRVLSVVALLLVSTAPPAGAVGPPPVDEKLLPAAGPAAPAHPTVQYDECVTAPTSPVGAPSPRRGIDLASVWALTRGAGQTVAVIDTGVARHRRLPHLVAGGDYVSDRDGTTDCDGHGTIVAGIIGATADSADPDGFSGIAPDVSLLAIRQSSNRFRAVDDPGGTGVGDVETLAAAVRTAADLGATVLNISTVACLPVDAGIDDRALGAALAYAVDVKNVVVVTAAGNVGGPGQCTRHNPRGPADAGAVTMVASPAWYDDYVLTVGSVGSDGIASEFSLAGPWVDVAAPGESVVSLAPAGDGLVDVTGSGLPISGTSYAVPVVSAIAALVRSRSPHLTARQVMRVIEDTTHAPAAGWDPVVGHGVVDALAAVTATGASTPAPPTVVQVGPVPSRTAENGSRRTALHAALACLALTAGVAVVSVAVRRSARPGSVPQD